MERSLHKYGDLINCDKLKKIFDAVRHSWVVLMQEAFHLVNFMLYSKMSIF